MTLLERFETDAAYYVYNACTHHIVEVGALIFDVLGLHGAAPDEDIVGKLSPTYGAPLVREALERVRQLARRGEVLFTEAATECIFHLDDAEIRRRVRSSLKQVTLGITEHCNLQCRYCLYTGSYQGSRVHARRAMSLDTATAAVDLLAEHSQDADPPLAIGFYGGEPLLEFGLIERVVAHARARLRKPVLFTVTTNGTLLTEAIIGFLRDNGFSLLVSVDGPEAIHDRNRRFGPSGPGSFALVLKNLRRIEAVDEHYFRTMVTLSTTLSFPVDLLALDRFVTELGVRPRISLLQTFGTDLVDQQVLREGLRPKGAKALAEGFAAAVVDGRLARKPLPSDILFSRALYWAGLRRLHLRNCSDGFESGVFRYTNICVPGATKLFVTCDGSLYACERADGMPALCLGRVGTGVDPEKVVDLVRRFDRFRTENCRDCWVVRLCNLCFFTTCHFDGWNAKKAAHYCEMRRRECLNSLRLYCSILEKNPTALDFLLEDEEATQGRADWVGDRP